MQQPRNSKHRRMYLLLDTAEGLVGCLGRMHHGFYLAVSALLRQVDDNAVMLLVQGVQV